MQKYMVFNKQLTQAPNQNLINCFTQAAQNISKEFTSKSPYQLDIINENLVNHELYCTCLLITGPMSVSGSVPGCTLSAFARSTSLSSLAKIHENIFYTNASQINHITSI